MPITVKTRGVLSTSGKGGVGKSLFTTGLAIALAKRGHRVGILDIDTRSPNIPYILGIQGESAWDVEGKRYPCNFHVADGVDIPVFSSSMLFADGKSVTMAGGEIQHLISDFIRGDVKWPDLEYLILDVDPGPGDSIMAARNCLPLLDAFVVTASDVSSIQDADRMLDALSMENIPTLGVVGNMVGAECPSCHAQIPYGDVEPIKMLVAKHSKSFLGYLPWSPRFRTDPVGAVQNEGRILFDAMARVVEARE